MKLRAFILSDAISTDIEGKLYIHGGGITDIKALKMPWRQPQLAFLLSFCREGEEVGSEHEVAVTLKHPDGQTLDPRVAASFKVPPDSEDNFKPSVNFVLTMTEITFPTEGLYWLEASVGDAQLASLAVRVGIATNTGVPGAVEGQP